MIQGMLEAFGLTSAQEAVYLALLDLPPVTVAEAQHACSHLDREQVRVALDRLVDEGLVSQLGQRPYRYAPVAPDVALESRLLSREERLRDSRALIDQLGQRFRSAPSRTGVEAFLEIVTGTRRVPERWTAALRSARQQIRALDRPHSYTPTSRPARSS